MPLKDSILRMREAMVNMRRNPQHANFVIEAFAQVLEDLTEVVMSAKECSDPDEAGKPAFEPQLADGTSSQGIIDKIRHEQTEAAKSDPQEVKGRKTASAKG